MAGQKSVDEWKKLFNSIDKDKNGSIDIIELTTVLRSGKSNVPEPVIKNVFQHFDGPNGNKLISLEEFIKGLQVLEELKKKFIELFKQFDADNSGYLEKKECFKLLDSTGQKFTEKDKEDIFKKADKGGDGKISLDEFIGATL